MQRRPNKNKQKMAINLCDLANILDKIVLSEHWKWLFRASRFQHVLGEKNPRPSWRSCDSARRWQLNRGFIYNL